MRAHDAELILDMTEGDYHADPCETPSLSSSIAKVLLDKSAAHAYEAHPRLGGHPPESSDDMDDGTVLHKLLLGCGQSVCLVDADDWRTKAAREKRDEATAAGQLPMLRRRYDAIASAAERVSQNIRRLGFDLSAGVNEASLLWREDSVHGTVRCRGRVDHLDAQSGLIVDLKKSRSAHPKACERHVLEYGYHVSQAAYTRGVEAKFPALIGRTRFVFLFVELFPPYAVTPAELGGALRELGERRWDEAVESWAWCMSRNNWPAYTDRVVRLEAPPWALRDSGDAAAE